MDYSRVRETKYVLLEVWRPCFYLFRGEKRAEENFAVDELLFLDDSSYGYY